jgi:hypothetical protein
VKACGFGVSATVDEAADGTFGWSMEDRSGFGGDRSGTGTWDMMMIKAGTGGMFNVRAAGKRWPGTGVE